MGAVFNDTTFPPEMTEAAVREAFSAIQDQDRWENGHLYSGGFGMAEGLTVVSDHPQFTRAEDARKWLVANAEKWREALAVRLDDGTWVIGAWCSS